MAVKLKLLPLALLLAGCGESEKPCNGSCSHHLPWYEWVIIGGFLTVLSVSLLWFVLSIWADLLSREGGER